MSMPQQQRMLFDFSDAEWDMWFDGAAVPNPGKCAIGAIIRGPGVCEEISRVVGFGTNNEAEYNALIAALERAVAVGARMPTIRGDSQLVINQVTGVWSSNEPHLQSLCERARALLVQLPNSRLVWVPRDGNAKADALSKLALGLEVDTTRLARRDPNWVTLTTVAKSLGISAIKLGKKLDKTGMRRAGRPTKDAIDAGLALITTNHFGEVFSWHQHALPKALAALEQ